MTAAIDASSEYRELLELLGSQTGLSFGPNRFRDAELGIRRAMCRAGVSDSSRYLALIQSNPAVLDDLIVEITIGETHFFRDPAHFDFVRTTIVPSIQQLKGPDHVFRVWSAGCASGEESYSLAVLFDQMKLGRQTHILGTDISRAALAKARQAIYGAWSFRCKEADGVKSYARRVGDRYELQESIRSRVTLEHLNLATDTYPSAKSGAWGMDLILCRNVLIYFDTETIRNVARRLYSTLADGGWLITGPSDAFLAEYAPWEVVVTEAGVFYQRGLRARVSIKKEVDTAALKSVFDDSTPRVDEAYCLSQKTNAVQLPSSKHRPEIAPPSPLDPLSTGVALRQGKADSETNRSIPTPQRKREVVVRNNVQVNGDDLSVLPDNGLQDPAASAQLVRSLASSRPEEAERTCSVALQEHALSPELHYLHALLLFELGRNGDAVRAARRVVYLDRSLAVAHFTLGSILRRLGDIPGAERAFRNAEYLAESLPAQAPVPLADGESAERLAAAAGAELLRLKQLSEAS